MHCVSLRMALSALIGCVLMSTLFVNIAIQALHAGPRVRTEAQSNSKLTRELVIMTIAGLHDADDPLPALRRLYESLGTLRHVDISVLANDAAAPSFRADAIPHLREDVPQWFVGLIGAAPTMTLVPVRVNERDYGRIAIVTNPLDELAEVWSDIEWLAAISLGVTMAILTLVIVLVRYSLRPFGSLRNGLAALESGAAGVRIPISGAREFRDIAIALNALATTLDRVKSENRSLVSKLIQLQDSERREIARDLHDDAGPALFSIRAAAVALQESTAELHPDIARLRQLGATIEKASEALQAMFRDLLHRLRSKGLAERGFAEAVKSLVASWRERRPDVALRLIMPHDCATMDDNLSSTAYRLVQEALTNVFRHADAQAASVRIEFGVMAEAGDDAECDATPALLVVVEDDGIGIARDFVAGLGLLGMRERVEALGGTLVVEDRSGAGTRVKAALPLPEDEED
jgi:two-component system, NarL family, sensor histidine kinase UhpB